MAEVGRAHRVTFANIALRVASASRGKLGRHFLQCRVISRSARVRAHRAEAAAQDIPREAPRSFRSRRNQSATSLHRAPRGQDDASELLAAVCDEGGEANCKAEVTAQRAVSNGAVA